MSAKILVVDDDETLRMVFMRQLAAVGYDVCAAGDAIAAVSTAVRERPDAILLDLGLPGGNGSMVLDRLRSLPATAMAAVVVITGTIVDPLTEDAFRARGVGAILTKPVTAQDLRVAVRTALGEPDDSGVETSAPVAASEDPAVRLRALAHDINNALGVVVGCAEFLEDGLRDVRPPIADERWDQLAQFAAQILASAEKGAAATRELLLSAREASAPVPG
jgi:CheY-like chemotaxis protein